jgi:hypothetical protein
MYLFYGDETNLNAKENEFFIYGGIAIPGDRALELSHTIDKIREDAAIEKSFQLKFKPKPENISHEDFNLVKQSIITTASQHGVLFLVSLILQNICTSISEARINEINRVFFHFDCLLSHAGESGVVLIDRFQDGLIDSHLREKFSVGLTGLPYSCERRLKNIVGYHYSAIGQSHFGSVVDICLGSIRFAVNVFTRNEGQNFTTAKMLIQLLTPLFVKNPDGAASVLSLNFSPKRIKAPVYLMKYQALKDFFTSCGLVAAQDIVSHRN